MGSRKKMSAPAPSASYPPAAAAAAAAVPSVAIVTAGLKPPVVQRALMKSRSTVVVKR
jgi:hypothetical protein